MKKMTKNSTLLFILFTALLIGTSSFSRKNSDLPEFKVVIENTKNGLKLIGQKGTAFKELSITIKENVPQVINQFGITMKKSKLNSKDENLADFEFTIEKTNKGFLLVGKKGTAWTILGFDFSKSNHKAIVDQYGVKVE